ncbi:MAG: hypothetical protein ACKVW3_15185 [Phycisphaerales bacterium]
MSHSPAINAVIDLISRGADDQALARLGAILRRQPDDPHAHNLMSALLTRRRQIEPALFHARRAADLVPNEPNLLVTLGNLLLLSGDRPRGLESLRRARAIAPAAPMPRIELAKAHFAAQDFAGGIEECRESIAAGVEHPHLHQLLSATQLAMGHAADACATLREAIRRHPRVPSLRSHLAFSLNYDDVASDADLFAAHREYGELLEALVPSPPRRVLDPDSDRRLRLGFLSPDLREHAVGFFAEPLIVALDRDRFEITCFHTGPSTDAASERIKASGVAWREVRRLDARALAEAIARDRIDVLVELSGHTEGHRLEAMHLRLAAVQATYLGYANTTGVKAIDLRLVDSQTDPTDANATERLVRLDPCFVCYRPPHDLPPIGPVPLDRRFLSTSAMAKIGPRALELWARVLAASPGSTLTIKNRVALQESVRARVLAAMAARGITADRIAFADFSPSVAEHLAEVSRANIVLDTTPYAGTTSTCEALTMGVPVVSLVGTRHAGRVGLSLLRAAGVGELAAADEPGFVATAARLMDDRAWLGELRSTLRGRVLSGTLGDAAAHARRFEAAIREAWREAVKHAAPGTPGPGSAA